MTDLTNDIANSTQNNTEHTLPRWGSEYRDQKAAAILQAIRRHCIPDLSKTRWLDLGCGSGGISKCIANEVATITGIDPEPWPDWSDYEKAHSNLHFISESMEDLSVSGESVDVVVCNQVYEHVTNPRILIDQIYRVLKSGGFCYFAGPNLLFPIEPHVFWPFIHWLPRNFAVRLMRALGASEVVDANSTTYWTLRKWLKEFEIKDIVPDMISDPTYYQRHGLLWKALSIIPSYAMRPFIWLSPGFVFILKKPSHQN